MNADPIAFLLEGLESYLEVERELGVRSVEMDRTLLSAPPAALKSAPPIAAEPKSVPPILTEPKPVPKVAAPQPVALFAQLDFAFIHDKPLSPKAIEMMSKIIVALGKTLETAPIVVEPPIPNARFFVFLGSRALAKYMPGLRGAENQWLKSPKGKDILLVKSPEEIVRFAVVTPALEATKKRMWLALKTLSQRVNMKEG